MNKKDDEFNVTSKAIRDYTLAGYIIITAAAGIAICVILYFMFIYKGGA
jgi:hypothetical protein